MIFISNNSLLRILNYKEDVFEVFSNAQQQMDDALKSVVNLESKQLKDIHFEVLQRNINIVEHGLKSGVPTGLRMLDNVTGGWQNTDLIILAGRPSMGKTATAVSMCIYPSLQQNIPVAIFSLEMSSFQLVCRIQSYLSEISVDKIIKGNLTMDEIRHIDNACEHIPKAPLYIDDTPNISLLELKSKCRKLVRENSVKMIVIDYLQLMRSGFDIKNREQEIAEISRGLKSLAKELNVPIIALSQLSRLVESRTDKKPLLSDLRESGQIEQDADMVIFTYRPQYYGIEQYEVGNQTIQTDSLMMLIVSKHRNGELGEMPMMFLGQFTKVIGHSMFEKNNVTFVPQQEPLKPNVDFLNTNYEEAEDPF
jgi:replicative DNA helicase